MPHSSKTSRAGAIGLLTSLFIVLAFIALAPLSGAAGLSQRVAAGSALLSTLEKTALSREPALGPGGASAKAAQNSAMFDAATTGLAGARLQKLLIGLAQKTGGRPRSVQVLSGAPDGALLRISVNLTISTDTRGLRDFLYEVETHSPLLFVDELTLRKAGGNDSGARQARRRDLLATMQVSGYMRKLPGS